MQLLRINQVQLGPDGRTYYHSRVWALFTAFMVSGASCWLVVRGWQTSAWPLYLPATFLMLGLLLFRRMITTRFLPTNWLVKSNEAGLYIQFRSYLNCHFPVDTPTVVFIAYPEIRSARLVRQRQRVEDMNGRRSDRLQRLIELELAGEVTMLAEALTDERTISAPSEKRWYGKSSTTYQDYPVHMDSPGVLRVEWSVVPRAGHFLKDLGRYVRVEATVSMTEDFSRLNGLSKQEQNSRLRQLDAEGQSIAAIYLARRLYGCSLAEAKSRIEELRAQKSGAGVAT